MVTAMTAESVVIVGVGMVTAVGLTATETAASVRAATMRFSESSFRDKRLQPITLAEIPEDSLPPFATVIEPTAGWTGRELRLLRLAESALRESLAPLAVRSLRAGLCLAWPEHETSRSMNRDAFLRALCAQSAGVIEPRLSDASHVGRAGGLAAISHAVDVIRQGAADFMVCGSVDTYRDPVVLAELETAGRLKTPRNMDGFIPGEGAGFVLLARSAVASAHGIGALAVISEASLGFEAGHLHSAEPYRGDGLASVFRQLGAIGAFNAPAAEVYSSMNGENHWAKEWGVAYLRNRPLFAEPHGMHHPADCFGDTGAASGPLLVGLAALGIAHGYRRAPALVYGSSDAGPRSALVVDRAH